ncbi:uncharacterized protein A4U43_C07F10880 [Asparagus officinalis]|uniref:Uncharacterized protein n=1 Tax=Asparagus officinalis TaxID=4686 RepID=A0A5P1EE08_ASPOF|nr:acyl transferase 4-like [Asparagus officinalis]ONK63049.1 uncharacterized protein A4U43_C07F10880 [Asparagus officinalis]
MDFIVTKSSQSMVCPASPTPSLTLDLSTIDRLPGLNAKVRTYHVFGSGSGSGLTPAKAIREALSKALAYYYPLAGRLVRSSDGNLQIECNAQGAWFIDATASCRLEDINYLSHPLVPMHDQLLPDPQPEIGPSDVLVLMQVTQFTCGGFVIGLESSHAVFDGLGSAQFLNCVAEFSRGLKAPTVEPVWYREAIPKPPGVAYVPFDASPPFLMPSYKLEQAIIDVSLDDISCFKSQFFELTGERCSVFDTLVARVWQRRTRAINLDPDVQVKLVFFANARPLVHPALPVGFYGNCFFPVTVTITSEKLVSASIVEVVKLIKKAKAKLPVEFARWAAGEGEDPYVPSLGYTTLFVSEWSRLGFKEIDYGWGTPIQVVPLTYSDLIPVCILGSPPAPMKGARFIAQCVEEEHLEEFKKYMMNHK